MSPYQPLWLEPELWLEPAPSQALVPEVCELHHPKPPQNWSCKSLPGFDLAHGSSSGFCCNQRAFLTFFFFFFWLKQLAKILGLALLVFPLLCCFLSLFGWWEEECLPGRGAGLVWAVSSRSGCEVPLPSAHRESKSRKGSSASRAKRCSQPAPGPKNFPLELLSSSAYSGLVLCCCCGWFQAAGTLQALFPVPRPPGTSPPVRDGMELRVLPEKVTSDQPMLRAEATIFHHKETIFHHITPWQWVSTGKAICAALLDFGMSRSWCVPPPGLAARMEGWNLRVRCGI